MQPVRPSGTWDRRGDSALFAKIDVNGKNADPLFEFLKFLVSRGGTVVERYAPVTRPEKIESDILKLL